MKKCISENCDYFNEYGKCSSACENNGIMKNFTNHDRIRNMDIDELAKFINECGHDFPPYCDYKKATKGICDQNCLKCAKKYLESEVQGE